MKKLDVLNMKSAGMLAITANDLDTAHAYKVIKFKKALKAEAESVTEADNAFLEEVGIKDAEAFDKERDELRKSGENPERLAEMDKQMERLVGLRKVLYEEEAKLEGVKALPFDQFHELQRENKNLPHRPLNVFEEQLEGILWTAPDEE